MARKEGRSEEGPSLPLSVSKGDLFLSGRMMRTTAASESLPPCVVTFRNTNSATMLLYSMMNGADADVQHRDALPPPPSFDSRETRVHSGGGDVDRRCKSRISRSAAAAAELHISNQSGAQCVGGREGTANDLSRKPRSAKSKRAICLNGWPRLGTL